MHEVIFIISNENIFHFDDIGLAFFTYLPLGWENEASGKDQYKEVNNSVYSSVSSVGVNAHFMHEARAIYILYSTYALAISAFHQSTPL